MGGWIGRFRNTDVCMCEGQYTCVCFPALSTDRAENNTLAARSIPGAKVVVAKLHSPIQGTRLLVEVVGYGAGAGINKMDLEYLVEPESKEVHKNRWGPLKEHRHHPEEPPVAKAGLI